MIIPECAPITKPDFRRNSQNKVTNHRLFAPGELYDFNVSTTPNSEAFVAPVWFRGVVRRAGSIAVELTLLDSDLNPQNQVGEFEEGFWYPDETMKVMHPDGVPNIYSHIYLTRPTRELQLTYEELTYGRSGLAAFFIAHSEQKDQ